MNDEADVGLVDSQAEGDGRDDDAHAPGHKRILHRVAIVNARVIVRGVDAVALEQRGQALAARAGARVDDAAAFLARQKARSRRNLASKSRA